MSTAVDQSALTAAAVAATGLPDWLVARRRADFETFQGLPMPNQEMEDWRRTDVSHIAIERFRPPGPDSETPRLTALPRELVAQGVIVEPLEVAARDHADLVRRYLDEEVVPAAAGKFAALNAAFWRGGVFVYVPPGLEVTVPVWNSVGLGGRGGDEAILPRSLVVIENGSSLIYTDEYVSAPGSGSGLSSAVTEVVLGDGARIDYLVLQEWDTGLDHFATHRINVGRDSSAELVVVASGANISKTYMEVAMLGPGSTARVSGLCIGDGTQHFDYQSLQDHHAPNCTSDLLVKTALRDSAVSVYSGPDQDPQGRPALRRLPGQPQPAAVTQGQGRLHPQARDRGQRRPLHARRHRGPGRRRPALFT